MEERVYTLQCIDLSIIIIIFLADQGTNGLRSLLQFMTALDEIPPLGLPQKIFVEFTEGSQRTFFAETCTFVLRVSTVHKEFREFKEKFLEASQSPTGFACI